MPQSQCLPAEEVQRALRAAGFTLGVDGIFGRQSREVLTEWLGYRTEPVTFTVNSTRTLVCLQTQTVGVVAVAGALRDLAKYTPLTAEELADIERAEAISRVERQPARSGTVVARETTPAGDLSTYRPAWAINWGTWLPVLAGVGALAALIWWGSRRPRG